MLYLVYTINLPSEAKLKPSKTTSNLSFRFLLNQASSTEGVTHNLLFALSGMVPSGVSRLASNSVQRGRNGDHQDSLTFSQRLQET